MYMGVIINKIYTNQKKVFLTYTNVNFRRMLRKKMYYWEP